MNGQKLRLVPEGGELPERAHLQRIIDVRTASIRPITARPPANQPARPTHRRTDRPTDRSKVRTHRRHARKPVPVCRQLSCFPDARTTTYKSRARDGAAEARFFGGGFRLCKLLVHRCAYMPCICLTVILFGFLPLRCELLPTCNMRNRYPPVAAVPVQRNAQRCAPRRRISGTALVGRVPRQR